MRLSPLDPMGWMFLGGISAAYLAAQRFEEAVDWADRALRAQPRWSPILRLKTVACAHLGRIEEARSCARALLLDFQPGFTISGWKGTYGGKAFSAKTAEMYIAGLRLAGVPE